MGNVLCFASIYLKWTFEEKSHEIGPVNMVDMKYSINVFQYVQYFASKSVQWTFEKMSHEIGSINYVSSMTYLLNTVQ